MSRSPMTFLFPFRCSWKSRIVVLSPPRPFEPSQMCFRSISPDLDRGASDCDRDWEMAVAIASAW
jgi:hypothetical protein